MMSTIYNILKTSTSILSRSRPISVSAFSSCKSCIVAQRCPGITRTGLFTQCLVSQQRYFARSALCAKEYDFSYTGDAVEEPPSVNLSNPRPGFEEAFKLLGEDDVDVKRMVSLEFADEAEKRAYRMKRIREALGINIDGSLEENVALLTIQMRSQMRHMRQFKKDQRVKHQILCRRNHRRNLLKTLRQQDKEAYDWIIAEFGITHTEPTPKRFRRFGNSRREKRISAARFACRQVRLAKIDAVKQRLATERESFEQYKQAELPAIISEMQELGLDLSGSVDDVLQSIGLRRVNALILTKEELRRRRFQKMMVKFGKVREQQQIRGLLPSNPAD